MKKQVLVMLAALFAALVILPVGAYAADAYAILYEDGTLVFQNGAASDGRPVKATYEVDLNAVYTGYTTFLQNYAPWYEERQSIRVALFMNKISPLSTAWWFYGCDNLERVDNIDNLYTDNVTSMRNMFTACRKLTALDVSHFNTAKVTNMEDMFSDCWRLSELDVSRFDTAKVTNMGGMFSNCESLTALDISGFDTANVTDMRRMFGGSWRLTVLDVSSFDTANVTDMEEMFSGCSGLTALDVSGWDTANVTTMSRMFGSCKNLAALDASHFDTANVATMSYMFSRCEKLTALDVSGFDTANVTTMSYMFSECGGLTALDVSHWDTANVTSMSEMFSGCSGLTSLDLSGFDTAKVENMYGMFRGCSNLKTIYASDKFKVSTFFTDSRSMFEDCASLIGGNGTKYDKYHIEVAYARIDAPDAPGYFTYKAAPADYKITAAVTENENLSVTLSNPGAATLAVSYFDANRKFVSVRLLDVPADAGTVALALSADAKTARVMLLDGALCPLCAAYGVALAL